MNQKLSEIQQLYQEYLQIWSEEILFTWRWWLGIGVIMLSAVILILLRRSDKADRLFYAGFFTAILSTILDLVGHYMGLWEYRYEVYPAASYFPWDIFMIPTIVMLLLYFKPSMNPWFKAIFLGLVTSLIGLPVLNWIGVYKPLNWHYIYSFPIQVIIYMLAHFVSRRTKFASLHK